MAADLRSLLFSTLYPSSAQPVRGIFVETRLRELLRGGGVQARVVAPVPWYPSVRSRNPKYAAMAATPPRERLQGLDVLHPRYVVIPKIGMNVAPFLLALGAAAALRQVRREGFDFDLIDAHYYYPDGVAAALLASWFDRPLLITARGTDVNLIPQHRIPRLLIQWAGRQAQGSIGVSQALVERFHALGMEASRLHVMRNGVDLQRFTPQPQAEARAALGIEGAPVILSVGNLYEHKGQALLLEAFARLRSHHPRACLVLIGQGPDRDSLERRARELGLTEAVKFPGLVPNTGLSPWYSAADVKVLASSREGWPNVLLEAMACGTPVVATAVGGIPEVIGRHDVGRLVAQRTPEAFAKAIEELLSSPVDRSAVRAYAQEFGWDQTSRAQLQLFRSVVQQAAASRRGAIA